MSYSHGHRKQLTHQLLAALAAMSATDFELLGHELAEQITGVRLRHRGLSVSGNPSGYTVDSYSNGATVVAECGTDPDYFESLEKPKNDFEHALREAPQVETVLLLSNRVAGNTAMLDVAAWENEIRMTTGILVDVYDARELVDVILDDILPRGRAAMIAPHLEPIRHLLQEQAASHRVPAPRPGALPRRGLEARIKAELEAQRVVLLSGMSGLGKTETAVTVASDRESLRDRVVWVTSPKLNSAAELEAVDVAQVGLLENLRGMLETRSCFVVLDDIQTDRPLAELLQELTTVCGPDARMLITSQLGTGEANDFPMEFLKPDEARALLEQDVNAPCPSELFESIWNAVGGHPLTLQLLNASAREEDGWDAVRLDVESVGTIPVPERRQSLANALVARAREAVEPALALFLWAGSSRIHEGFARAAVRPAMIRLLRRLAFVASDRPDTIRLHDIVWSSVSALQPPLEPNIDALANDLHRFVRQLGSDDAGTLALNHVARLHQRLLRELVSSGCYLDGHLYAWLHHLGPGPIGSNDLPDPVVRAEALVGSASLMPVDDFSVQVAVELAETAVRLVARNEELVSDTAAIAALVRPFDILLESDNVSREAKHHVQHHRAKALKRLRREGEAVTALESLLEDAGSIPASRLLLGRMLTEPRVAHQRRDNGTRAKELLLGLLDEASEAPDRASVSVVLAAAELLRRHVLRLDLQDAVRTYAELLEPMIVGASERGLEQGVLTFAALGEAWLRVDREQFFRIYCALPLPSWETIDPNEREAWGELLKIVADELNGSEREQTLEQAVKFLLGANSRYGTSHAADAYVRLGRPQLAVDALERWFEHDTGARHDAWLLLRLSDAQAAAGQHEASLASAEEAWTRLRPSEKHRAHFAEQLAKRLEAVGRVDDACRMRSDGVADDRVELQPSTRQSTETEDTQS